MWRRGFIYSAFHRLACWTAVLGLAVPLTVAAENEFELGPTELNPHFVGKEKKAWEEQAVVLPSFPRTESDGLITLPVWGTDYRYTIDLSALTADPDGVVRYSIAITSTTGARNIFYEGLRCQTAQYKTYAYGSQGGWSEAVYPAWRTVTRGAGLDFRKVLYKDYFCDEMQQPREREKIVADLKHADSLSR